MNRYADLDALKANAARFVAMAMDLGADTAAADVNQYREFESTVRNGETEMLVEAESFALGLTVSKNRRRANVNSCDVSERSMAELAAQALEMCRYTDEDPWYSLPEKDLMATETADYDLFDPRHLEMTAEEKIHRAAELERATLARDPRLKSDGAYFSDVVSASAVANSLGLCLAQTKTKMVYGMSAFAEDRGEEGDLNTGRKQISGWGSSARHRENLFDVDRVADEVCRRVLRKLGGRKPKTGKFPVYFEPGAAKTLWGHFLKAISGSNVFRRESYLTDRLNTEIGCESLTVVDDPTLRRGLGSRAYDNEGVLCRPLTLIENGALRSYIMSTYSANKLGMRATGHAGGSTNLVVKPGALNEEEMLRRMGTGVWVTSLLGQGANVATGDYSRGALGLWVENGQPAYPIMEFTLNGTLDRMFKNIVMLGSNVLEQSATLTPGLVIGEMTVSGN